MLQVTTSTTWTATAVEAGSTAESVLISPKVTITQHAFIVAMKFFYNDSPRTYSGLRSCDGAHYGTSIKLASAALASCARADNPRPLRTFLRAPQPSNVAQLRRQTYLLR